MGRPPHPHKVDQLFALFGINLRARLSPFPENKILEEFDRAKEDAHKEFKRLAMIHHPDRQGGDERKFKELSDAWSTISGLNMVRRPQRPPPQPINQVVRIVINHGWTSTASSSATNGFYGGSSTTYSTCGGGWKKV